MEINITSNYKAPRPTFQELNCGDCFIYPHAGPYAAGIIYMLIRDLEATTQCSKCIIDLKTGKIVPHVLVKFDTQIAKVLNPTISAIEEM